MSETIPTPVPTATGAADTFGDEQSFPPVPDESVELVQDAESVDICEEFEPWSTEYSLRETDSYQYEYTRLRNILENRGRTPRRASPDAINLGYLREVIANRQLLGIDRIL